MISASVRRPVIPEVKTLAPDRDEDVVLDTRQQVRFCDVLRSGLTQCFIRVGAIRFEFQSPLLSG